MWDNYLRTDSELLTKQKLGNNAKNLNFFDAVMFYSTGELDLNDEQKAALLSFVKDDGKCLLGTHSATDTFYQWTDYGDLIGAYFNEHPWGRQRSGVLLVARAPRGYLGSPGDPADVDGSREVGYGLD